MRNQRLLNLTFNEKFTGPAHINLSPGKNIVGPGPVEKSKLVPVPVPVPAGPGLGPGPGPLCSSLHPPASKWCAVFREK